MSTFLFESLVVLGIMLVGGGPAYSEDGEPQNDEGEGDSNRDERERDPDDYDLSAD